MTVFQPLLTNEDREGTSNDNFEVSVTEKKLPKLFKNVAKLFKDIVEIESSSDLNCLDTAKLSGRNLIIFYGMNFNLDDLVYVNRLFMTHNISIIYCDCE